MGGGKARIAIESRMRSQKWMEAKLGKEEAISENFLSGPRLRKGHKGAPGQRRHDGVPGHDLCCHDGKEDAQVKMWKMEAKIE
jgi:hypothetical protein